MSFLSMRSSADYNDEEKGDEEPKRRIRPLSANFSNLDILGHFKKNNAKIESNISDLTRTETIEQSKESNDASSTHSSNADIHVASSPPPRRFSVMSAPNRVPNRTWTPKRTNSILLHPMDSQDGTLLPTSTRETAVQSLDDDDSLPSVFGDDEDEGETDGEGNPQAGTSQGIAFADNIEKQRELARRRLEQDRKFDEILQRIAGDNDSTVVDHEESRDVEEENEEMKRIMREPIHKHELTRQQRYRLGGAEYRALDFLAVLVPMYYLFWCRIWFCDPHLCGRFQLCTRGAFHLQRRACQFLGVFVLYQSFCAQQSRLEPIRCKHDTLSASARDAHHHHGSHPVRQHSLCPLTSTHHLDALQDDAEKIYYATRNVPLPAGPPTSLLYHIIPIDSNKVAFDCLACHHIG
jgi:hypothetical protein